MKDIYGQTRKADMSDGIMTSNYRPRLNRGMGICSLCYQVRQKDGLVKGKSVSLEWKPVAQLVKRKIRRRNAGNFVRGQKGRYVGTSGTSTKLRITLRDAYFPNEFGLYNMAGNVNEWVLDVYRSSYIRSEMVNIIHFEAMNIAPTWPPQKMHSEVCAENELTGACSYRCIAQWRQTEFSRWRRNPKLNTDFPCCWPIQGAWRISILKIRPNWYTGSKVSDKTRVYKICSKTRTTSGNPSPDVRWIRDKSVMISDSVVPWAYDWRRQKSVGKKIKFNRI